MRVAVTFGALGILLASSFPASAYQEDPEATGACIHSVSTYKVCNEITRRWCITGGFANASFYEGMTCGELKEQGLY